MWCKMTPHICGAKYIVPWENSVRGIVRNDTTGAWHPSILRKCVLQPANLRKKTRNHCKHFFHNNLHFDIHGLKFLVMPLSVHNDLGRYKNHKILSIWEWYQSISVQIGLQSRWKMQSRFIIRGCKKLKSHAKKQNLMENCDPSSPKKNRRWRLHVHP